MNYKRTIIFFIIIVVLSATLAVSCGSGGGSAGGGGGGDTVITEPIADMSGVTPTTAFVGDTITLDGSSSSDPDGSITSFSWDLGNGTTVTGENTTYSYSVGGTYTVTLTVTDNSGNTNSTSIEITIHDGTPAADAGGVYGPAVANSDVIDFDGSASYDTNTGGSISTYDWNFGDGNTASGVSTSYTYTVSSAPDNYSVTLTVTDDDGKTDTDTTEVRVHEAPVANAGNNKSAEEGVQVNFDASESYDPDSDGSIVAYGWDWDNSGTYNDATGVTAANTWNTAGTYTVGLQVTDNDGAASTDEVTVTVVTAGSNLPPTADAGGPYGPILLSALPVSFDGSGSTDDNSITIYSWNFGDTETSTGATVDHTYASVGDYTVELTVTDNESATDTDSTVVRVHEEPVADINDSGNPEYVINGEEFALSASESEPDGGLSPVDSISEYRWDFNNDGTTDATTSVPTINHVYSTNGEKTVSLEVLDSSGVVSTNNETYLLTVHEAAVADTGGPYTGSGAGNNNVFQTDDIILLDASGSNDPDAINGSTLLFEWDYDYDGITFTVDDSGSESPNFDVSAAPIGATPGNYTMAVRVTDPDDSNITDIAILDYRVNEEPVASFTHTPDDQYVGATTTYDALEGETISFDASGSSDADGSIESYSWDFGDGNVSGQVSGNGIDHIYAASGTYTVQLIVTDNDGRDSVAATQTLEIADEGDVNVTIE